MPFRKSIRLHDFDYSSGRAYFVTICSRKHKCLFGDVKKDTVFLSRTGQIVESTWLRLADNFAHVFLDQYVLMPNHLHGIIILNYDTANRGRSQAAQTEAPKINKPLGQLIGAFKTRSTKLIVETYANIEKPIWQRNYYEHVIRNKIDLENIRRYIVNNPMKWALGKNC